MARGQCLQQVRPYSPVLKSRPLQCSNWLMRKRDRTQTPSFSRGLLSMTCGDLVILRLLQLISSTSKSGSTNNKARLRTLQRPSGGVNCAFACFSAADLAVTRAAKLRRHRPAFWGGLCSLTSRVTLPGLADLFSGQLRLLPVALSTSHAVIA